MSVEKEKLLHVIKNGLIDDAIAAFNDYQDDANGMLYVNRVEDVDDLLSEFTPSQILRMLCGFNIGDFIVFDDAKKTITKVLEKDLRNFMACFVTDAAGFGK